MPGIDTPQRRIGFDYLLKISECFDATMLQRTALLQRSRRI